MAHRDTAVGLKSISLLMRSAATVTGDYACMRFYKSRKVLIKLSETERLFYSAWHFAMSGMCFVSLYVSHSQGRRLCGKHLIFVSL